MVLRKLQIDVDLNKVVRYNPEVWGRVGDKDLVVLNVSAFDTSDDIKEVVDLTGATMYFTFARPDGTYFRDSLSISNPDLKNGKFDYTLPANAFAQAGVFNCHFRIEQGGTTKNRTSTRDFKLVVDADPLQGNIAMPNFASDIDQLNADIQAEIADSRAELDDALAELATATTGVDAAVLRANAVIASIDANQVVPISSTTNWQKGVKITADNGYSKGVPAGVADWNAFTETGLYSVYATSLMANKPPAVGLYLDVEIHRRSGDTTFQRVTDITNNKTYYRSQMVGVWTAWAEGETVANAQIKADNALASSKTYSNNQRLSKMVFSGVDLFNVEKEYLYNLAADEELIEIRMFWGRYDKANWVIFDYDYSEISTYTAVQLNVIGEGKRCKIAMPDTLFKFAYIYKNKITGHAHNYDTAHQWCLRGIEVIYKKK